MNSKRGKLLVNLALSGKETISKEMSDSQINELENVASTSTNTYNFRQNRQINYKLKHSDSSDCPSDFSSFSLSDGEDTICTDSVVSSESYESDVLNPIEGNYLYNENSNVIRPVRRPKINNQTSTENFENGKDKYLACPDCLGFFKRTFLRRHRKTCSLKPKNNKLSERENHLTTSQMFKICGGANKEFYDSLRLKNEVFKIMRPDEISKVAMNDILICSYGESLLSKHKRIQIRTTISNKMRELARQLITLRKTTAVQCFFDVLKPELFDNLVSATKIISGYNPETRTYKASSLALHMGTTLKQVCDQASKMIIKKSRFLSCDKPDESLKNIKRLKNLIISHWNAEVSSLALKDLNEKQWEKPKLFPFTRDIINFQKYVLKKAKEASDNVTKEEHAKKEYRRLSENILALTLLLNRKRIGEIQYLKVKTYNAEISINQQEEFLESLSESEKVLTKNFKRVITGGKGSKPVAILFPKDTQKYINVMLNVRSKYVPQTNEYLFANPGTENRWLSGYHTLKKLASESGVENKNLFTSTRLRKQIATVLQVMNITDSEMEQFAAFMGHTKKTHETYYRLPQDVYQTAKVSKLLLAINMGKGALYKGKTLDEIEFSDNLDSDSEPDSNSTKKISHNENAISNLAENVASTSNFKITNTPNVVCTNSSNSEQSDNEEEVCSEKTVSTVAERQHSNKPEVIELLGFSKSSKEGKAERRNIIALLRYETQFRKFVETGNSNKLPCIYCKRLVKPSYLKRHYKVCVVKPINKSNQKIQHQAQSQTLLACAADTENTAAAIQLKNEVFLRIRADDIALIAKKDDVIRRYGENYLKRHKRAQIVVPCSNKIRECAKLLKETRRRTNNNKLTFFDIISTCYYDIIVASAKTISRYDDTLKEYLAPSLAIHLGFAFEELESEPAEVTSSEEPFLPQFNNFDMDTFLECDKNSSVFQEFNAEEVFKMVLEDQSKNKLQDHELSNSDGDTDNSPSAVVTTENEITFETASICTQENCFECCRQNKSPPLLTENSNAHPTLNRAEPTSSQNQQDSIVIDNDVSSPVKGNKSEPNLCEVVEPNQDEASELASDSADYQIMASGKCHFLKEDAVPSKFNFPAHLKKHVSDRRILKRCLPIEDQSMDECFSKRQIMFPEEEDPKLATTMYVDAFISSLNIRAKQHSPEKIKLKKRIKVQQQKVRRRNKKITSMKGLIEELKKRGLSSDNLNSIL
ncbi:hypothetical protein RN001_005590 [Aquatica leii]|uniref:Uncharacterized protein n=1 Tax=Aquatica leii TaxID=1421715 RepID=A0AAN7SAN5_9COLE|nr:hypothetical protein RN001_005590 [Aquatica leii]